MKFLKSDKIIFNHGFLGKNIDYSTYKYINKLDAKITKDQIANNKKLALKSINIDLVDICIARQIHSDKVMIVDDFFIYDKEPEADALVTNNPDLALGIITADCVPILLEDSNNKIIAAIHAGWRGAKSDLILNTINSMVKLGANLSNISAVIGPCIFQKSYEVDQVFMDNFINESQNNHKFFIKSSKENHYMFDLLNYTKNKLYNYIDKIDDIAIDTFSNDNKFFSYRRCCVEKTLYDSSNITIISMHDSKL